jgi:anti-sigma factor RsiW
MRCQKVEPELIAYHFGLVSDEARTEIEAHLLACGACLCSFLDLKRAVETGEDGPVPSRAARARLRRAVAEEVLADKPQRAWSWWERPLAFAFAGSAVLAAMITMRVLTTGPGAPPYALSAGHLPAGLAP